ncbi:MAG: hypothetical protein OCD02_16540 [Spirochaetaceae bacterium]
MIFSIIYIHGFASVGDSSKGLLLKKSIKNHNVFSPTLSPDSKVAIKQIKELISSKENPILIGSSLGGFYVDYFNTIYGIPAILINPLVDSTKIKVYIGENKNLYTDESFEFTLESYNYLQDLKTQKEQSSNYSDRKANMFIMLAKDDDVIDYKTAELEYNSKKQTVYTYDTGGHRFINDDEVISKVEKLISYVRSSKAF